jgi:DNA-binding MarR family transcriptional regulator
MRMAQTIMHRDFINTLKELDLTQKQVAVLALLDENPDSSQVSISNTLESDPATMMAMMDRLEDRGLIYRTRSRIDRRKQELNLTDAGKTILQSAYGLIAGHEKRFRSLFTPAEVDQLITLLQKMQTFSA